MPATLHLLTPEYPPQCGGVADYSHLVAAGLAGAGFVVHVWCPRALGPAPEVAGVEVHPEFGQFHLADLRRAATLLDRFPSPRRLLVQWVPHGYGWRSMNVPFCLWLYRRAHRRRDWLDLMVHEAQLDFAGSWRQRLTAVVHRLMAAVLLRAVRRVWVTTPDWEVRWRPYTFGRPVPFRWLPVFSNVPVCPDALVTAAIRRQLAASGPLVGRFGTAGSAADRLLVASLLALLQGRPDASVLLLGRGSEQLRAEVVTQSNALAGRVHATGALPLPEVSTYLSACDVLLQPVLGGVTGRNASVLAGLAHGKPIVTTLGPLTEPLWQDSGAVRLAPPEPRELAAAVLQLLADPSAGERLAALARQLYQQRFDRTHTIAALSAAGATR